MADTLNVRLYAGSPIAVSDPPKVQLCRVVVRVSDPVRAGVTPPSGDSASNTRPSYVPAALPLPIPVKNPVTS